MRNPLRPKQPRNLWVTLAVGALAVLAWAVAGRSSPKAGLGLAFGVLAAAGFVVEMSYPFRRPHGRPFGTARSWLQAHVYLGGLIVLFVFLHTGFAWPHGWMGWALLGLTCWVAAGGLLGVLLQKWIPFALADGLSVEALYEEIPGHVQRLVAEADTLVEGAGDTLQDFYRERLRPSLTQVEPSWAYLLNVRAGRARALEPLNQLAPFVEPEDKPIVEDLVGIRLEKLELDAQYRLQGLLRRWLGATAHAVLGGLLVGLVVVHIAGWLLY